MKSLIIDTSSRASKMERTTDGKFKRIHDIWDGKIWNDGYVDNKERFRVYRPDYPRCFRDGYAMRSHVVWWLETGHVHPKGKEIHHKDENKLNDIFSNFELLTKKQHDAYHRQKMMKLVDLVCDKCGKLFQRKKSKANRGNTYNFCSRKCNILHRWAVREK